MWNNFLLSNSSAADTLPVKATARFWKTLPQNYPFVGRKPRENTMSEHSVSTGLPPAQGLYDPRHEHDACGIGFVANIKGQKSHDIIVKGIQVLINLTHRGACGCDPETGDGAGVLIQIPHKFFVRECEQLGFALPVPGRYAAGMVFL